MNVSVAVPGREAVDDCAEPAARSSAGESVASSVVWPRKYDVCGVLVSATSYEETVACLLTAAERGESAVASFFAVHAVVTAGDDERLREAVNRFEIVAPDGQPVRWALRWLHGVRLAERVYGPETTLRLCAEAARRGLPVYLYGGANEEILERLQANLTARFPGLHIAGAESPPFRALTAEEDEALVERLRASGARLVLIGLGCPKQDLFAAAHRDRVPAAFACVGAAFDFHAGVKQMAPAWMQRRGLEWLYRLLQEPRRLARRYLVTNTVYLGRVGRAWLRRSSEG